MSELSTKERDKIPDNLFGIPELRKYPLVDMKHVRSAEAYFRFAPPKFRESLRARIDARKKELTQAPEKAANEKDVLKVSELLKVAEHGFQKFIGVPSYYHDKKYGPGSAITPDTKKELLAEKAYLDSNVSTADYGKVKNRAGDLAGGLIALSGAGVALAAKKPRAALAYGAAGLGVSAISRGLKYLMPDEYLKSDRRVSVDYALRKGIYDK